MMESICKKVWYASLVTMQNWLIIIGMVALDSAMRVNKTNSLVLSYSAQQIVWTLIIATENWCIFKFMLKSAGIRSDLLYVFSVFLMNCFFVILSSFFVYDELGFEIVYEASFIAKAQIVLLLMVIIIKVGDIIREFWK